MVGEHIRALKGGRWNHAIDCGDETVIHLDQDGERRARVLRAYRPEFVAGAEVVEVVTHRERTFAASEVVARAYSRIADPGLSSTFRDSEAFADWCVTGRLNAAAPSAPAAAPVAEAPSPAPAAPATPGKRKARKTRKAPSSAGARSRNGARARATRAPAKRQGAARSAAKKPRKKKTATARRGRPARRR
jgi:hypothetical protein